MSLHLNIEDLISTRTVETDRIEFKEGWNPDAIYRSICAFANDFENTGGGYIVVGVAEENGVAKRPVKGLTTKELADIQRKMIGFNNLILPVYNPKLSIETVDDKQIIVLWVPGGSNRPYQVPERITASTKRNFYYIRKYANSVKAELEEQQELISLANQVPFDDRPNTQATIGNIAMLLVRDYLIKVKSKLSELVGRRTDTDVLSQMELISGPNEHIFPRNVALMMFSDNPEKYFPCSQVEVVHFPNGEADTFTEYDPITGPIPSQIKNTLDLLTSNFLKERISKPTDKAESTRIWNYPYQAIEETLVNAFYHRDYQQREPIEIRIYPASMVFINHGGPDRSIQMQAFQMGMVRSRRYRNRRLGDFLKELELTEGRATGIPTILKTLRDNGSPPPRFNTDEDRTFFEVELFIHPDFAPRAPFVLPPLSQLQNRFEFDNLLNEIIRYAGFNPQEIDKTTLATIQAGNPSKAIELLDSQVLTSMEMISPDQATTIATTIAATIAEKEIKLLTAATKPINREYLLDAIGLKNLRYNYQSNVKLLEEQNWLTMTVPDKPTSPNQQYLTTLKGRLVLEFLKRNTK